MLPQKKSNNYLEVQMQTASKEQLLLMLFDGALRFCDTARARIEAKDIEGAHKHLVKAKAIVVELMCSLDKRIGDTLYNNLMGLYNFVYLRLLESNFKKDLAMLAEAVRVLSNLRETWELAVKKNQQEGQGQTYHFQPAASNFNIQG